MQINDQALMSIVDLSMEKKNMDEKNLGSELDFFFDNVMDTVVEFFELEKV